MNRWISIHSFFIDRCSEDGLGESLDSAGVSLTDNLWNEIVENWFLKKYLSSSFAKTELSKAFYYKIWAIA